MELSPEDRQRIYEEEKARLEIRAELESKAAAKPSEAKTDGMGWFGVVMGLGLVIVPALWAYGFFAQGASQASKWSPGSEAPVTLGEYESLMDGITLSEANAIIGETGIQNARNNIGGFETVMYTWTNPDGSAMNAMFQNGKMIQKAQAGLK